MCSPNTPHRVPNNPNAIPASIWSKECRPDPTRAAPTPKQLIAAAVRVTGVIYGAKRAEESAADPHMAVVVADTVPMESLR